MIINVEVGIWKELLRACLKVLFWHLLKGLITINIPGY
jgi:hypothetical protein